jgi:16S rRNA (guanine1207-N2)-methyltransferase
LRDFESAVLETLVLPIVQGTLALPSRVGFLRARHGAALQTLDAARFVCEQTFKPDADALERAGFLVRPSITSDDGPLPLVLVLPPRQREEARALLARAVLAAAPSGRVLVAASNNAGARSLESDLAELTGQVTCQSKNKCRVFWTAPMNEAQVNAALVEQWRVLDAPRPILEGRFLSRPGIFAWDRIDPASQLLAEELPAGLAGRAADLGAGFGYLAVELLQRCPGITSLDLYEAEARALDLARENVRTAARPVEINSHWHDVTTGLLSTYDVIVSNPPFHSASGGDDPGLGRRFITAAARALNPGGRLWLVANRHLPYENVLSASFGHVRIVVQRYGFKIIEATRSRS